MPTLKYRSGSSWIDIIHPVNSIYMSNVSTSPATLFGGTWTQLTNAVLRAAAGYGYGGSDTHTLTINEMPSHNHSITNVWNYQDRSGNTRIQYDQHNALHPSDTLYTNSTGGGRLSLFYLDTATSTVGYELPNLFGGEVDA